MQAAEGHGPKHRRRGYRLRWWSGVLAAALVPLSLLGKVGFVETWQAFNRYTRAMVEFPQTHPIRLPSPADPLRNYTAVDQDLIGWQEGITQLYGRISRMAVVGVVTDSDAGLEFAFSEAHAGGKKGRWHAERDASVLLYFGLSAAAYFLDNVHLALVVLNLNLYNIALCLRLKGLSDATGQAVESLKDAQAEFLMLPMERSLLELVQQQMCLQKMQALIGNWAGTELGMSLTLPLSGQTVTIGTSIMASLAAATTVKAIHSIVYGFIPGLPRIRWRQMLGSMVEAKAKLQHSASEAITRRRASFTWRGVAGDKAE